jgi:hypothetical protein
MVFSYGARSAFKPCGKRLRENHAIAPAAARLVGLRPGEQCAPEGFAQKVIRRLGATKKLCCRHISQVGKGGMPPLWFFFSLSKNKRAGACRPS